MKIGDIIRQQARLRNRVSICNAVIRFLYGYISTTDEGAKDVLVNSDGSQVAEEDVKDFCQSLADTILSPSRAELEKMADMDIVEELIARLQENPDLISMSSLQAKKKKSAQK